MCVISYQEAHDLHDLSFSGVVNDDVVASLGLGLPGGLYNASNVNSRAARRIPRKSVANIIDVSKVDQWSQLCGPRSFPRRHFFAVEADEGRCLDVAGTGPIERGMNVQVDQCVYARDVDTDADFDLDRAFRQNFCFLNDSTIRFVAIRCAQFGGCTWRSCD